MSNCWRTWKEEGIYLCFHSPMIPIKLWKLYSKYFLLFLLWFNSLGFGTASWNRELLICFKCSFFHHIAPPNPSHIQPIVPTGAQIKHYPVNFTINYVLCHLFSFKEKDVSYISCRAVSCLSQHKTKRIMKPVSFLKRVNAKPGLLLLCCVFILFFFTHIHAWTLLASVDPCVSVGV